VTYKAHKSAVRENADFLKVTANGMYHNHSTVCLKTGRQTLPKIILHTVRSSASCLNLQCPPFSLMVFQYLLASSSSSSRHFQQRVSEDSSSAGCDQSI